MCTTPLIPPRPAPGVARFRAPWGEVGPSCLVARRKPSERVGRGTRTGSDPGGGWMGVVARR